MSDTKYTENSDDSENGGWCLVFGPLVAVVLVLLYALHRPEEERRGSHERAGGSRTQTAPVPRYLDLAELVGLVADYQDRYDDEDNDFKRRRISEARRHALSKLPRKFDNWSGSISMCLFRRREDSLNLEREDHFVIRIEVDSHLGELHAKSVLRGSWLYNRIGDLDFEEGDRVEFSGSLLVDEGRDWFSEVSRTERGAVMEPEFRFELSSLRLKE